jgi:hypothetical protein
MTGAGLSDVRVETVDHGMRVESGSHLWNMLTSAAPPLGALAAKLSEEQKTMTRSALDAILNERPEGTPANLNMQFHIGIGTK